MRSTGSGGNDARGASAARRTARTASRSSGSPEMTRDASPGGSAAPVRAGLAERVPDVRGGEQAGGRVQLAGAHTGRVPRPVDALVVTAHDRCRAAPAPATGTGCVRSGRGAGAPVPTPRPAAGPAAPRRRWGRRPGRGRAPARPGTISAGSTPAAPARAARASSATPRECPWKNGVLRSAASPNPASASSRWASSRNNRRGCGSAVHDRGPDVVRVRDRQQLRGRVEEDRGDRRVERAARPAGHRLGRQLDAADCVEHDRGEADRGEPRRLRHLVAGQSGGRPLAVEAFERAQHGPAHGLRQLQPLRQVGADLTVRPGRLLDDLGHPRGAGQHPQLLGAGAQPGQEPQRLQRAGSRRSDLRASGRRCRRHRTRRPPRARSRRTRRSASGSRRRPRPAEPAPDPLGAPVRSPAGTRASPHPADGRGSGHSSPTTPRPLRQPQPGWAPRESRNAHRGDLATRQLRTGADLAPRHFRGRGAALPSPITGRARESVLVELDHVERIGAGEVGDRSVSGARHGSG